MCKGGGHKPATVVPTLKSNQIRFSAEHRSSCFLLAKHTHALIFPSADAKCWHERVSYNFKVILGHIAQECNIGLVNMPLFLDHGNANVISNWKVEIIQRHKENTPDSTLACQSCLQ